MTMNGDDSDAFESLHQLVASLSEIKQDLEQCAPKPDKRASCAAEPGFSSSTSSTDTGSRSNKAALSSTVLLENLVEDVCISDLRIILEEYGEVIHIHLLPGSPGNLSARATFVSQEEAESAVKCLHGIEADGRILACRFIDTPDTTDISSSNSILRDEAIEQEGERAVMPIKQDVEDPEETVKIETFSLKAETEAPDLIDQEEEKQYPAEDEPPKPKLVEWTLDMEAEPAGNPKDELAGQQKIPVHESERIPRSLRRVAVDAAKSPPLSNFPERELPPHKSAPVFSTSSRYNNPHHIGPYISAATSIRSGTWSAYETMYAGGSTGPTSVNGHPLQSQYSAGTFQTPKLPPPYYPQYQPYRPYQPNLPYSAVCGGYPYNALNTPTTNLYPISSPSRDPRTASVDGLLKEAGIDNLEKLRMLAPELRSLELLIVDLSREYPRLLPTFGDRFFVKNVLRQYLQL